MGKIKGGILGGVSGAIGAVVGSRWKGIDTLRARVTPANPRTIAQTTQRTLFGTVSKILTQFLVLSLRPILDPVAVKMSGFNLAAKRSLDSMGDVLDTTRLVVSSGPLDPPDISGISSVAGQPFEVFFPVASAGDVDGTDVIRVSVITRENGEIVRQMQAPRSNGGADGQEFPGFSTATHTVLAWATRAQAGEALLGSPTSSWGVSAAGGAAAGRKDTTF